MGILKIFPLLGNKALICSYSCSLCSACKENLPQMDLEFTGELHRQPKHKMLRYASPDPSFPRFSTVFVSAWGSAQCSSQHSGGKWTWVWSPCPKNSSRI